MRHFHSGAFLFPLHIKKNLYFCSPKNTKMENVRISFEVPYSGGFTVKELTDRARHFVMELVNPNTEEPSDEEIALMIQKALTHLTLKEEQQELARRIKEMEEDPASTYTSTQVFEQLETLL